VPEVSSDISQNGRFCDIAMKLYGLLHKKIFTEISLLCNFKLDELTSCEEGKMSLVPSPRIFPLFLCVAASLFLSPISPEAQVSPPNKTFKFSLAAVAKVIENGQHQIVPLTDNMVLRAGNLIKFYLELENEGYLYFFHEDSRGVLDRLFPVGSQQERVSKYTPVNIPEGNSWIELDSNTGKETFHLLVSIERLEQLEKLYNQHVILNAKSEINQSAQAILNEIKSLKRQNLLGQAEKPIRLAGKLRGNSSDGSITLADFRNFAVEITTTGTYVKSVTIDHK
jgi:hypothetical protein